MSWTIPAAKSLKRWLLKPLYQPQMMVVITPRQWAHPLRIKDY
jgi:hypothetical protein